MFTNSNNSIKLFLETFEKKGNRDIMGASPSGMLDEAKIGHIKGKIKRSLLFLGFSAFSRTANEDIISQPYLNRSFPQTIKWDE